MHNSTQLGLTACQLQMMLRTCLKKTELDLLSKNYTSEIKRNSWGMQWSRRLISIGWIKRWNSRLNIMICCRNLREWFRSLITRIMLMIGSILNSGLEIWNSQSQGRLLLQGLQVSNILQEGFRCQMQWFYKPPNTKNPIPKPTSLTVF